MKFKYIFIWIFAILAGKAQGQTILKGTIKTLHGQPIAFNEVEIKNTAGLSVFAGRSGNYQIEVRKGDTIRFYYRQRLVDAYIYNKGVATPTYNVTLVMDEDTHEKAHALEDVKVYGRNYLKDSLARRERYENLYNYKDPKLATGDNQWAEYVMVMGEKMQLNSMDKKYSLLDIQSLIHVLGFKKRKQRKRNQQFALASEHDAYIRHRLKKELIEKYGQIHNEDSLNTFIQRYAPAYEDLRQMSDFEMYQYIASQSKLYREGRLK